MSQIDIKTTVKIDHDTMQSLLRNFLREKGIESNGFIHIDWIPEKLPASFGNNRSTDDRTCAVVTLTKKV